MSSQKSIETRAPVAPTRERGRRRVAAITEAAAAVFTEKGYEGATMAEIAVRSGTAIGSLYRFFPTKDALAEALLSRYGERVDERLRALLGDPAMAAPRALVDALVALMLELGADRALAVSLADARPDLLGPREQLRQAIRRHVAALLRGLDPVLPRAAAERGAVVLWRLLKAVPPLEEESRPAGLMDEAKRMLCACVEDVIARGTGRRGM